MSAAESYKYMPVDLDQLIPYSANFRWREALFLREWGLYVYPTQTIYQNILKSAQMLEAIRGQCGNKPITVKSWYRPQAYNDEIGGRHLSSHLEAIAVDFSVATLTCDRVREILMPSLERLKMRMEDNPGSDWVHSDLRTPPPGGKRFFKP
jgi:hypothetical protein